MWKVPRGEVGIIRRFRRLRRIRKGGHEKAQKAQTKLSTGGEFWFIFEPFVLSCGYSFSA
jgi:hypothetical protein